ncbi:MAG: hypothetical protein K0M60_02640 [Hydrogenophaga sp.]|nr:hypothetical protein [Hydrogenophaga sp.]
MAITQEDDFANVLSALSWLAAAPWQALKKTSGGRWAVGNVDELFYFVVNLIDLDPLRYALPPRFLEFENCAFSQRPTVPVKIYDLWIEELAGEDLLVFFDCADAFNIMRYAKLLVIGKQDVQERFSVCLCTGVIARFDLFDFRHHQKKPRGRRLPDLVPIWTVAGNGIGVKGDSHGHCEIEGEKIGIFSAGQHRPGHPADDVDEFAVSDRVIRVENGNDMQVRLDRYSRIAKEALSQRASNLTLFLNAQVPGVDVQELIVDVAVKQRLDIGDRSVIELHALGHGGRPPSSVETDLDNPAIVSEFYLRPRHAFTMDGRSSRGGNMEGASSDLISLGSGRS